MLDAENQRLKSERSALRRDVTIKALGLAAIGAVLFLCFKPRLFWMPVVITLIGYGLTWYKIERDFRAVSKTYD